MESRGNSDDVGNRVECSDLVEMNVILRNVMDFGFRLGQSLKAGQGPLAYRTR